MQPHHTIAYLERYAPAELDVIRAHHPNAGTVLVSEGITLGSTDDDRALFEATQAMLTSISETAQIATREVTVRLSNARRIEILGSVIGLLSSGAVVGVTVGLKSLWGGTLFGLLSFLAAALPQIVNWLRQSTIGAGSAVENLVKLREGAWDARQLLDQFRVAGADVDRDRLIEQGNSLAKTIYFCLNDLGYNPRV